jgi:hypothetical protein
VDLRIAVRASVPIVAVAVLGAVAVGRRATVDTPAPLTKASKFVANCDRMDYAALEDHFGRGNKVTGCDPGQFGEPAALVMVGQTMHLIGRDLRELVPPRELPDHESQSRCGNAVLDSDLRVTDVDGDGVDEIIDWMGIGDDINIRVIAIRDGKLAISRDHRYIRSSDPVAAARAILANCHFD